METSRLSVCFTALAAKLNHTHGNCSGLGSHVPVAGVLVELAELPVDGEDVHVVVLLEVVSQQVQRVIARLQPLLVLVDLLHLEERRHKPSSHRVKTILQRAGTVRD